MDDDLPSLGDLLSQGFGQDLRKGLFSMGPGGDNGLFSMGLMGGVPMGPVPKRLPYKARYGYQKGDLGGFGEYDPAYLRREADVLRDDNNKALAWRHRLFPKETLVDRVPLQRDPELMYRGMSDAEMRNILRTGIIESKGRYNIGSEQEGLTYFDRTPQSAESYSSSFAPRQHKPTFDKPAFVVAAKLPPESRIRNVQGTGNTEVGVIGPTSMDDVASIFRGKVVGQRSLDPIGTWLHWEPFTPKR